MNDDALTLRREKQREAQARFIARNPARYKAIRAKYNASEKGQLKAKEFGAAYRKADIKDSVGVTIIPISGPKKPIPDGILFDEDDRALIEQFSWDINSKGYARTGTGVRKNGKRGTLKMHQILLGPISADMDPDHINRNKLDNRRSNLRIIPKMHNQQNKPTSGKSGFRNVVWSKQYSRWQVIVKINKVPYFVGRFQDKVFAAAMASTYRAIYMPGATD